MRKSFVLLVCLLNVMRCQEKDDNSYQFLGELPTYAHGVTGQVWADTRDPELRTVRIVNLNYDGTGPDAYFWAGTSAKPDVTGFIIPDENGSKKPLKGYKNADIVLKLPKGKSLRDIKWFSIWCRKFRVNFGDIKLN